MKQKLKTRVIKKNINPEWNEELTLSVADPSIPIRLVSNLPLDVLNSVELGNEIESHFLCKKNAASL